MDEKETAKLRCRMAQAFAAGKINDTLRRLRDMPLDDLLALSVAEMKCQVDCSLDEMDIKEMEKGLEKLNFYVCGILMHRILEGE
jgi:hypothetical protein